MGCDPSHFMGWLAAAPPVIFLCFPFIFPSEIYSQAPATCRTGTTPFAQALLSTSGTHFRPVPSSLRGWRHILPFTFTPRAAGLWLGQDVPVGSEHPVSLRHPWLNGQAPGSPLSPHGDTAACPATELSGAGAKPPSSLPASPKSPESLVHF